MIPTPFSPATFLKQSHTCGADLKNSYPVLDDKGKLAAEKSGWWSGPTKEKHKPFLHSVKVWLERDKKLQQSPLLKGVNRELELTKDEFVHKKIADRSISVVEGKEKNFQTWVTFAEEWSASQFTPIHDAESALVGELLSIPSEAELIELGKKAYKDVCKDAWLDYRDEIKKIGGDDLVKLGFEEYWKGKEPEVQGLVNNLVDEFATATHKHDPHWENNLKAFLAEEKETVREQCSEHIEAAQKGVFHPQPDAHFENAPEYPVPLQLAFQKMDEMIAKTISDIDRKPTDVVHEIRDEKFSQIDARGARLYNTYDGFIKSEFNYGGWKTDDIHGLENKKTFFLTEDIAKAWESGDQNRIREKFIKLNQKLIERVEVSEGFELAAAYRTDFEKKFRATKIGLARETASHRAHTELKPLVKPESKALAPIKHIKSPNFIKRAIAAFKNFCRSKFNTKNWKENQAQQAIEKNIFDDAVLVAIENKDDAIRNTGFRTVQEGLTNNGIAGDNGEELQDTALLRSAYSRVMAQQHAADAKLTFDDQQLAIDAGFLTEDRANKILHEVGSDWEAIQFVIDLAAKKKTAQEEVQIVHQPQRVPEASAAAVNRDEAKRAFNLFVDSDVNINFTHQDFETAYKMMTFECIAAALGNDPEVRANEFGTLNLILNMHKEEQNAEAYGVRVPRSTTPPPVVNRVPETARKKWSSDPELSLGLPQHLKEPVIKPQEVSVKATLPMSECLPKEQRIKASQGKALVSGKNLDDEDYRLESSPEAVERQLTEAMAIAQADADAVPKRLAKAKAGLVFETKMVQGGNGYALPNAGTRTVNIGSADWPNERDINYSKEGGLSNTGVATSQGHRPKMEDAHLAVSFPIKIKGQNIPVELSCVFDGHGGPEAAKYCADNIERLLKPHLQEYNQNGFCSVGIVNALNIAFAQLNNSIHLEQVGTTANVVMKIGNSLWTANLGDSRAVLATPDGKALQLSEDGDLSKPRFVNAIKERGGYVAEIHGGKYLGAQIATPGTLGYQMLQGQALCRPTITHYTLPPSDDEYLIVQQCDGITDVATTAEIVNSARQYHQQGDSEAVIAAKLTEQAELSQCGDNKTVVVRRVKYDPALDMPLVVSQSASDTVLLASQPVAAKAKPDKQSAVSLTQEKNKAFEAYGDSYCASMLPSILTGGDLKAADEAGLLTPNFVALAQGPECQAKEDAFYKFQTELLQLREKARPTPVKQPQVTIQNVPQNERLNLRKEAFMLFVATIGDSRYGLTVADVEKAYNDGVMTNEMINACLNKLDIDNPQLNQFGRQLNEGKYKIKRVLPQELEYGDFVSASPQSSLTRSTALARPTSRPPTPDREIASLEWGDPLQSLSAMQLPPMDLKPVLEAVLPQPVPTKNITTEQRQTFAFIKSRSSKVQEGDFDLAVQAMTDDTIQAMVSGSHNEKQYELNKFLWKFENLKSQKTAPKPAVTQSKATMSAKPAVTKTVAQTDKKVTTPLTASEKNRLFIQFNRELDPSDETGLKRLVPSRAEFDLMVAEIDPDKIRSQVPPLFIDKLKTFRWVQFYMSTPTPEDPNMAWMSEDQKRQLKALSGGEDELRDLGINDFVTLVNQDLFSSQSIKEASGEYGRQRAKGVMALLDQQAKDHSKMGFGLTSWGSTCWMNTAKQTMVRMVSDDVLASLEQQRRAEPEESLRVAFCKFVREGKAILAGKKPSAVITNLQIELLESCQKCAKAGVFGVLGENLYRSKEQAKAAGEQPIQIGEFGKIKQAYASDFVDKIFSVLEIEKYPEMAIEDVIHRSADYQGLKLHRHEKGPILSSVNAFAPTNSDLKTVCMEDWFRSFVTQDDRIRHLDWKNSELPPHLKSRAPEKQTLRTQTEHLFRVDSRHFSKTRLAFAHQGIEELVNLARATVKNSGMHLNMDVINENGEPISIPMRMTGLALHRGNQDSGHYLQLSFDERGRCFVQDDSYSMPFADFNTLRGENWNSWEDMMEDSWVLNQGTQQQKKVQGYKPDYCSFEKAGEPVRRQVQVQKAAVAPVKQHQTVVKVVPDRVSRRIPDTANLENILYSIVPGEPAVVALDVDDTLMAKDIFPDGSHRRVLINPQTERIIEAIRNKAGTALDGSCNVKIILLTSNDEDALRQKFMETGLNLTIFDKAVCVMPQTGPIYTKGQGISNYLTASGYPAQHVVMVDDTEGALVSVEQACNQMGVPYTSHQFKGAKPMNYRTMYENNRSAFPELSFQRFCEIQQMSEAYGWDNDDLVSVYLNESPRMRSNYDQEAISKKRAGLSAVDVEWRRYTLPTQYRPPEGGQQVLRYRKKI